MIRSDSDSELTRESEGRGRREGHVDLGLGHAGHGLLDELEVVLDGVQLLADDLRHLLAADACLGDVLVGELGAGAGDLVEHLCDEVLEVEHLHALVPQDLGEGVVLLLRDLQERDVVEQESLELVGGRLRSSSPGRCRQTFLSLPISEGTCRPFVMASYLSFGPFGRISQHPSVTGAAC